VIMVLLDTPRITLNKVDDAVNWCKKTTAGTHSLMMYPDLRTLGKIYSQYTKTQLEDCNEIVLILPYYETPDMVRFALSGASGNYAINDRYPGIDVSKYEREGSLIIIDSIKGYFSSDDLISSRNDDIPKKGLDLPSYLDILLKQAERKRKTGVSVLSDLGSFYHYYHKTNNGNNKLIEYESSLPKSFDGMALKGFCLYHQKDFESRFSQKQQALLQNCHSLNLDLVSTVGGPRNPVT
jgi:hypothetical protein